MNGVLKISVAAMLLMLPSCAKVEVTHKVEPIHLTVDINIRIDRQLDDFFSFEQQVARPGTQPAGDARSGEAKGANP